MDAEVYPDPRVVALVTEHFVPVRVHVKQNRDEFQRLGAQYNAQWTPAVLILDRDGTERHRIEGFLPVEDFLSQLDLGMAKAAFARKDYRRAEQLYQDVLNRYPSTDAAPEAQYWAGVSRYRATNDPAALKAVGQAFQTRFQDSQWAKKASIWKS
ncbi:MAG TPA: thioredoxin fold domain-containing protein [Vicinamibacterales bacterium]|nr:thioredoxin fold domain-containing protein [Vicinamibacterales bacterium]